MDGGDGGLATGNDVLHHDRRIPLAKNTFNQFGLSVCLGRFPHGKHLKRSRVLRVLGEHPDRERNGVCSHREPSHRVYDFLPRRLFPADERVHRLAHQPRPLRVQRGQFAIHIIIAARARGEGEVAVENRLRAQQFKQLTSVFFAGQHKAILRSSRRHLNLKLLILFPTIFPAEFVANRLGSRTAPGQPKAARGYRTSGITCNSFGIV